MRFHSLKQMHVWKHCLALYTNTPLDPSFLQVTLFLGMFDSPWAFCLIWVIASYWNIILTHLFLCVINIYIVRIYIVLNYLLLAWYFDRFASYVFNSGKKPYSSKSSITSRNCCQWQEGSFANSNTTPGLWEVVQQPVFYGTVPLGHCDEAD